MAGSAYAPVIVGLAVGAAFVIILFSVSSSNSDATSDKVSIVTISDGPDPNFEPNVIRVVIGINNTVRWINEDSVPYTIASDTDYRDPYSGPFSTEGRAAEEGGAFVMPGQFFEFTFTKAGIFDYHSLPRPQMKGTVVVLGPGSSDDAYKEIVDKNLKQDIENTPLTVYVDKASPTGDTVQIHAVQGFLVNPVEKIIGYEIYPTWQGGKDLYPATLADIDGNIVAHDPIFHDSTQYSLDAICPHTDYAIENGTLVGNETDKATVVYYGPQFSVQLYNSDPVVIYYNYSLGTVEPDENGTYRLTFVTPYEASIELSNSINMQSYERANCASTDSKLTMPYFDITFGIDQ